MPRRTTAPVGDESKKTTPAPKTEGEKKVVEKFPATEKLKKFLEKAEKGLSKLIFETREIEVGKTGEAKSRIVYVSFAPTPKGEDHEELTPEDDVFNVQKIKDVLFHYHTSEYTDQAGMVLIMQVLQPALDDPNGFHLLAYQEIKEN